MNAIAPVVTIFFLLAYFAVNLSCLALDLASAPNFRPTFKYFSWHTALLGAVGSIIMCFIVSPAFASIAIGILLGLLAMLHLRDFPRASWGSISQALIFHQVRKYLLLLDPRKEHVKFWRPQMLLLVANPRSSITLIDVVNDMKKGGLFIVGHVTTTESSDGSTDVCALEYPHWVTLIDQMKIKAFVDVTSAKSIRDGATHLMRLSGLGGLRPNTVILGFYDDVAPEDHLRTRPFFKRLWLKSTSGAPDTVRLNLDEHATSVNGSERSSVFAFPGRRPTFSVRLISRFFSSRDRTPLRKPNERTRCSILCSDYSRRAEPQEKCLSGPEFSSFEQRRDWLEQTKSVRGYLAGKWRDLLGLLTRTEGLRRNRTMF